MSTRAIFTVIILLFLAATTDNTRTPNDHAYVISTRVAQRVSANAHTSAASINAPEEKTPLRAIAPRHFEPFLLLLLGSGLFSAGTTIKFLISRRAGHQGVPRRVVVGKQRSGSAA